MMPLTAAFVVGNRALWEQAHACVQNLPVRLAVEHGVAQSSPSEADELLDRLERHRIDVVLVEPGLIAIPLEEFVRRLHNTASQPAVFVLNPDASPQSILDALRAGANEYLYPPLTESLRDALQRLAGTRSKGNTDSSRALGRVFGFLSARGGCGATTFAAHVAIEIARQTKQQTLLADLDFEAGILRFLMKAKNSYSVRDAIDNLHRMDSSLWAALVSALPEKLYVIPASDEVPAKRSPSREEILHLLRFIRSTYPISIIDFGRSTSTAALHAIAEMEAVYLIATPEAATLEHARRAVQSFEDRGFGGKHLIVVLNRVGDKKKMDRATAEKRLGRPFDLVFREDHMALYDAYSEGKFLPASNPLFKELRALAESMTGKVHGGGQHYAAPASEESKAGFALRGFSFLQKMAGFGKDQTNKAT